MVPEKRTILAISGALAVAFALPGCAPAGYNQGDYGGTAADAQPAANAARVEASPTPAESEEAESETEKKAPELTDEELTNELIAKELPRMGEVVTDEKGWVLYRFDKDTPKPAVSNCAGKCAELWPPALTDGDPELDGVSSDLVGTVQRADGTRQLTIGGWPVYRYAKDQKPGQWKGQAVGNTWYVVAPDGSRNVTCLPPGAKAPSGSGGGGEEEDDSAGEKGASDEDSGSSDSGSSGGDYNY